MASISNPTITGNLVNGILNVIVTASFNDPDPPLTGSVFCGVQGKNQSASFSFSQTSGTIQAGFRFTGITSPAIVLATISSGVIVKNGETIITGSSGLPPSPPPPDPIPNPTEKFLKNNLHNHNVSAGTNFNLVANTQRFKAVAGQKVYSLHVRGGNTIGSVRADIWSILNGLPDRLLGSKTVQLLNGLTPILFDNPIPLATSFFWVGISTTDKASILRFGNGADSSSHKKVSIGSDPASNIIDDPGTAPDITDLILLTTIGSVPVPEPIPEPEPDPTDQRVAIQVTNKRYERLASGSNLGALHSTILGTPNQEAVGLFVKYVIDVKDSQSGLLLNLQEVPITLNSNNSRDITVTIPDFDLHQSITVTWQIIDPATFGVKDTFQQTLQAEIEPPTEKPNTSFTVTFSDSSILSFILSDADYNTLISRDPVQEFFVSSGVDTDLNAKTLAQVDQEILDKVSTLPPVPDDKTFSQEFIEADYISSSVGKSILVKVRATRQIDNGINDITGILQIKNQAGGVIHLIELPVIVQNDTFDLNYGEGDLPNATATITIEHFIQNKDAIALSNKISIQRTIRNENEDPEPLPKGGSDFLTKFAVSSILLGILGSVFGGKK